MALARKVAIITGASSGLGRAIAILFAREGASLTLCGRDQKRLKEVMDQCIKESGGQAKRFITVQGDVTNAEVRKEMVAKTVKTFGRLDVLVPNAGVLLPGVDIEDADEKKFDTEVNTNVKAVFFLIQQALPSLEKSKGNIICISSIVATVAVRGMSIYGMSKAALEHMIPCLALDLAPKKIRINAVSPAYMNTNLFRNTGGPADAMAQYADQLEKPKMPMGKFSTIEDVANVICFLASDAGKVINGQRVLADGGRTLNGAA